MTFVTIPHPVMPATTSYPWPLRPFDRRHPVRAYFNDPRVADRSKAFHFGIDIACADGTPVYAVDGGTVHLESGRALSVVTPSGRTFGYWHVVPGVKHRQAVGRGQRLGAVEAPWGHLHFAESRRHGYVNPLRPGGLAPWADGSSPRIVGISFERRGKELSPLQVRGAVDVVVEAYDRPPLPVPPPWADMPVTPACVRWRLLHAGKVVRPWHTPVDFRRGLLPAALFDVIFAPGTRQNHPNRPGRYRFFAAHTWDTRLVPNGLYTLQAEVGDAAGNKARASLQFTIANRIG